MASPSPSPLYTRLHSTTTAFLASYAHSACSTDITALSSALTPTCLRYLFPRTIAASLPGFDPDRGLSNTEYEAAMQAEVTSVFESWEVEAMDVAIDEVERKGVVHFCMEFKSEWPVDLILWAWIMCRKLMVILLGRRGKVYPKEFIMTLFMIPDGTKIEKIHTFVDAAGLPQHLEDEKENAE